VATCPEHNRIEAAVVRIDTALTAGAVTMAKLETRQAGVLWLLALILGAVLVAAVTGVWNHVYPPGRNDVMNAEVTAHRDAWNAHNDAKVAHQDAAVAHTVPPKLEANE